MICAHLWHSDGEGEVEDEEGGFCTLTSAGFLEGAPHFINSVH